MVYSLDFVYNTKILCKINQAAKQASKPNDFGQASQASKLKVSKIASQQAEGPQLGLLAYYQLWSVSVIRGRGRPDRRLCLIRLRLIVLIRIVLYRRSLAIHLNNSHLGCPLGGLNSI